MGKVVATGVDINFSSIILAFPKEKQHGKIDPHPSNSPM
jgi:hypothetical protein